MAQNEAQRATAAVDDRHATLHCGRHLLLYDGVCGLCNRAVQFVLRHDARALFRFAPLQSALAASVLHRYGAAPESLDTMYVVVDFGRETERLLRKSRAAVFVLTELGRWSVLGRLLGMLPEPVLNAAYDRIVRHRYRMFGKLDQCPIPAPEHRARFL